jgi:Tol biopolymer transport system component
MTVLRPLLAGLLVVGGAQALAIETLDVVSRFPVPQGLSNGSSRISCGPQSSADGRWWVYCSAATDVIPGLRDINGAPDVFLLDRETGETRLVSHALGDPLRAASDTTYPDVFARISRDGSTIYFQYAGGHLTPEAPAGATISQLYRYDIATGINTLVTRAAGNAQASMLGVAPPPLYSEEESRFEPSDDGSRVVFRSASPDLVAGVTFPSGAPQAFVFDASTGHSTLASRSETSAVIGAGARQFDYPGGRYLAYLTDDRTVLRFDLDTQAQRVVARPGVYSIASTRIAHDGGRALFASNRPDLVPGAVDNNEDFDFFTWTASDDVVRLVSHAAGNPLRAGNGGIDYELSLYWMRRDGAIAYYATRATDHSAGVVDANLRPDFLRHDFASGITSLVTRAPLSDQTLAGHSGWAQVSDDGASMLFTSAAVLVPGLPNGADLYFTYRWSAADGTLSVPTWVLHSHAEVIDASTCFSVRFVTDTHLRTRCRVRFEHGGEVDAMLVFDTSGGHYFPEPNPASALQPVGMQPGGTDSISMSGDGTRVLFRGTDGATLVSRPGPVVEHTQLPLQQLLPNEYLGPRFLTHDGQRVILTTVGLGGTKNVYWYDLGERTLHAVTEFAQQGLCLCVIVGVSDDGRRILLSSNGNAWAAGDNPGGLHQLYLHDTDTTLTTLVTRRSARLGGDAMHRSHSQARLSRDGNRVFYKTADLAVADLDVAQFEHIVVHDVAAGTTRLVTHRHGQPTTPLDGVNELYAVDAEGRQVLFYTTAKFGVMPEDPTLFDAASALYLQDMNDDRRLLISHEPDDVRRPMRFYYPSGSSLGPWLSADGRTIVLDDGPERLVRDGSVVPDISMMYDVDRRRWSFIGMSAEGEIADSRLRFQAMSRTGGVVLFTSAATNLADEASNAPLALYRYVRRTGQTSLVSRHAAAENLAAGMGVHEYTNELSDDGRVALFTSSDSGFVQDDVNAVPDLYRATYSTLQDEIFCDGMERF